MAVASNADAWAVARQGIYFPASSNNTNQDGDLTGQCVSLDKWFLAEMCNVPSPFMARGDAKDFGDNLVAQGLATRVSSPQRGDLVVFPNEAAPWGHIGVMLDAVRMFEENAGVAGVASKVVMTGVGPFRVYASRIGRIDESWRHGPPVFYRVKSYVENAQAKPKEEEVITDTDENYNVWAQTAANMFGRKPSRDEFRRSAVGQRWQNALVILQSSVEAATWYAMAQSAKTSKSNAKAAAPQKVATLSPGIYEVK